MQYEEVITGYDFMQAVSITLRMTPLPPLHTKERVVSVSEVSFVGNYQKASAELAFVQAAGSTSRATPLAHRHVVEKGGGLLH